MTEALALYDTNETDAHAARYCRATHRVRLLGSGAQATALQLALPHARTYTRM